MQEKRVLCTLHIIMNAIIGVQWGGLAGVNLTARVNYHNHINDIHVSSGWH